MAEETNGERVTYGRFLAEHAQMKADIAELKQEQREFLTQARTVFGLIGDKERLQLHALKLDIGYKYYLIAVASIGAIWYFSHHQF